ncbi:hypothetical protein B0H16DRAFT_417807 [Mycena metata]|uniref:Uncharacterized protein n=1 Tax=Mycena metata TaxID=1033252 RepID=A0AAD7HEC4_9AGAR|nr:hypothetical protein B0H16DRAFT_417807 [Mycena metata]
MYFTLRLSCLLPIQLRRNPYNFQTAALHVHPPESALSNRPRRSARPLRSITSSPEFRTHSRRPSLAAGQPYLNACSITACAPQAFPSHSFPRGNGREEPARVHARSAYTGPPYVSHSVHVVSVGRRGIIARKENVKYVPLSVFYPRPRACPIVLPPYRVPHLCSPPSRSHRGPRYRVTAAHPRCRIECSARDAFGHTRACCRVECRLPKLGWMVTQLLMHLPCTYASSPRAVSSFF